MARRAAWVLVGLLWGVALLNYLDRQLLVNVAAPVKAELHIDNERFGLLSSLFLWIYGLCSPVAGFVADRIGRKPVILASLLLWSTATAATGLVESFTGMLIARALLGVSEAFYMPAAVALIVDHHAPRTRSRATGLHLSGVYVGSILGGLGGWLADHQGWRFGFVAFGSLGIVYALFLIVVLKVKDGPVDHEAVAVPESHGPGMMAAFVVLLSVRSFVILLLMNALNGAAYWPVRNWLPSFFNSELGVSLTWSGLYGTTAFNASAFVGMLLGGSISDRLAVLNPRVRALVPAVGFCLAAPCLFAMGMGIAVPALVACVFVVGMSQGFLDANLMPAVCTVCALRYRATAYGLMNFVGTTAGGVMTYVGGALKDAAVPFGVTFQFAAGFILIAGLLLFAVRPR